MYIKFYFLHFITSRVFEISRIIDIIHKKSRFYDRERFVKTTPEKPLSPIYGRRTQYALQKWYIYRLSICTNLYIILFTKNTIHQNTYILKNTQKMASIVFAIIIYNRLFEIYVYKYIISSFKIFKL